MDDKIELMKEALKKKVSEEEFSNVLERINSAEGDKKIACLGELCLALDKDRVFDQLQNFEIPLGIVEKVFHYIEHERHTD